MPENLSSGNLAKWIGIVGGVVGAIKGLLELPAALAKNQEIFAALGIIFRHYCRMSLCWLAVVLLYVVVAITIPISQSTIDNTNADDGHYEHNHLRSPRLGCNTIMVLALVIAIAFDIWQSTGDGPRDALFPRWHY
jgi:hypothetical protein